MEEAGEHTHIKESTIAHSSRTALLTCFPHNTHKADRTQYRKPTQTLPSYSIHKG